MSSAYFSTVTAAEFLNAGRSVTGIDINNDGFGDLIIGAEQAVNADATVGQVLVIYGSGATDDFNTPTYDLTAIGGFIISGGTEDGEFGWDVLNAGDQNGDGRDDLAIVSRGDGTITVIFGRDSADTFGGILDLNAGIGSDGYIITGIAPSSDVVTVSGGTDVSDDGIADLIIGVSGGTGTDTVYVVYGNETGSDISVADLNGTNGFAVTGLKLVNTDSFNIGAVGDLNNDGIDDILLGRSLDPETGVPTGDIVVMYGGYAADSGLVALGALAPETKLILTGLSADEASSASVSGDLDINGDGIGDLVIGVANDDAGGVNAGKVYVVFGNAMLGDTVNLNALDGSNGFVIKGLDAGDRLGLIVQSLGDVSGDGRDDLGVMTAAGDLYVIYGIDSEASFDAEFDLDLLNGDNGYAITGLFGDAVPETLSLAGLPSINSDGINDIAIGATFELGGTSGETFVILGGAQNFQNLDAADLGGDDGTISFAEIDEVAFAATNGTILIEGDTTGEITEDGNPDDGGPITGAISITDSSGDTTPTFAGRSGTGGVYGGLVVTPEGDTWIYTLNTDSDSQAVLQALNVGGTIIETITVDADGAQATQTIRITITGIDDPAVFNGNKTPTISEDIAQFTESFTLTDIDNDDPSLAGLRFDGTYGYIQFNATGDAYTFFQTDAGLQSLEADESRTDTITVTDSAGNMFDIVFTFTGADEDDPLDFIGNTDDQIFTSYGNDWIRAFGGADTINAGAGNDRVEAGDGNDIVLDGLGNDTVDGGDGNDRITLLSGQNIVDGGAGSDFIRTGYMSDDIKGGDGNDVISADSGALFAFGNDRIEGGKGDDIMQAGAGADTFVFRPGDGNDTIARFDDRGVGLDAVTDFTAFATGREFEVGIDKIELIGFDPNLVNAGNIFESIKNEDNSAVFSAEGTSITFFNVLENHLSVDDFIFV